MWINEIRPKSYQKNMEWKFSQKYIEKTKYQTRWTRSTRWSRWDEVDELVELV